MQEDREGGRAAAPLRLGGGWGSSGRARAAH